MLELLLVAGVLFIGAVAMLAAYVACAVVAAKAFEIPLFESARKRGSDAVTPDEGE